MLHSSTDHASCDLPWDRDRCVLLLIRMASDLYGVQHETYRSSDCCINTVNRMERLPNFLHRGRCATKMCKHVWRYTLGRRTRRRAHDCVREHRRGGGAAPGRPWCAGPAPSPRLRGCTARCRPCRCAPVPPPGSGTCSARRPAALRTDHHVLITLPPVHHCARLSTPQGGTPPASELQEAAPARGSSPGEGRSRTDRKWRTRARALQPAQLCLLPALV